ncbi:hypothetical protein ABZ671_32055 [Micromonospora sp. NPDC006766]|uniref:hypothetical protein n=1 Tax=Micromonospora sp. NPDC006766 TaxID=3154778 RepID=UPI0034081ADA
MTEPIFRRPEYAEVRYAEVREVQEVQESVVQTPAMKLALVGAFVAAASFAAAPVVVAMVADAPASVAVAAGGAAAIGDGLIAAELHRRYVQLAEAGKAGRQRQRTEATRKAVAKCIREMLQDEEYGPRLQRWLVGRMRERPDLVSKAMKTVPPEKLEAELGLIELIDPLAARVMRMARSFVHRQLMYLSTTLNAASERLRVAAQRVSKS